MSSILRSQEHATTELNMPDDKMKTHVFAVLDDPYCVWEHPHDSHNIDFLSGIDVEYFRFVADIQQTAEPSLDDERRAATLLRSVYHQALETLFSMIGAALQAPTCVYGWLAQCKTDALRSFVERVSDQTFRSAHVMPIEVVSWQSIATWVHGSIEAEADERSRAAECFADFWARCAALFLQQQNIDEYNSLKHGFRVESGGFTLQIGEEGAEDAGPLPKLLDLGGSKYGSSYLRMERVGDSARANRSLIPRRHRINWSVEQTRILLRLLSISISNVISFLKAANGVTGSDVKIFCPTNEEFRTPWDHSIGVLSMNMDRTVPEWAVRSTTRDELNEYLVQVGLKRSN